MNLFERLKQLEESGVWSPHEEPCFTLSHDILRMNPPLRSFARPTFMPSQSVYQKTGLTAGSLVPLMHHFLFSVNK